MKKYKVEFTESEKFVVDVLAENEAQAKELAEEKWQEVCKNGTYHYLQYGDSETEITTVYDVTNTDDPFNP